MNPRERLLAMVIGAAVAALALYQTVKYVFVSPLAKAETELVKLAEEESELDEVIASSDDLARRWMDFVGRTFAFEPNKALDRFGVELKEIAKQHGFDGAVFSSGTGTSIGSRTGIKTVAHRIGIEGGYDKALAFLRDIYKTPYLCQITKLSLAPMESKGERDMVKLECTVEAPVLPQVDKRRIREVANAEPMSAEPGQSLPPFRGNLKPDEAYQILSERNILRPYQPPPTNVVMIDNQDWKTVAASVSFRWDRKVLTEKVETVAGKASLSVQGKGDVVEIEGRYADGVAFGPKEFDFSGAKKDWTYQVPVHHDPPPPEVIDLAVDNQHSASVQLEVVVTAKDKKTKSEPTMVFGPGRSDVREYKDVESVVVTAKYPSGATAPPQTFTPTNNKQTYNVPPEPQEIAEGPRPVEDLPADGACTVSALLTYEGAHEMVVMSGRERHVIRAGVPEAVDGGTLLAVHPLGGIVRMPTGNYYLYPLGRRFNERVKLAAGSEIELAAAIDAWSRQ